MSHPTITPDLPTADTKVVIVKSKPDKAKMFGHRYDVRLGGNYDWNSYLLAHINAGVKGYTKASIGGGFSTSRTDFWVPPSKVKTQIKTLADFSELSGVHFFHNDDGVLFVGSRHWAKTVGDVRKDWVSSTSADDLTFIC